MPIDEFVEPASRYSGWVSAIIKLLVDSRVICDRYIRPDVLVSACLERNLSLSKGREPSQGPGLPSLAFLSQALLSVCGDRYQADS